MFLQEGGDQEIFLKRNARRLFFSLVMQKLQEGGDQEVFSKEMQDVCFLSLVMQKSQEEQFRSRFFRTTTNFLAPAKSLLISSLSLLKKNLLISYLL